jgi:hypothetical protein
MTPWIIAARLILTNASQEGPPIQRSAGLLAEATSRDRVGGVVARIQRRRPDRDDRNQKGRPEPARGRETADAPRLLPSQAHRLPSGLGHHAPAVCLQDDRRLSQVRWLPTPVIVGLGAALVPTTAWAATAGGRTLSPAFWWRLSPFSRHGRFRHCSSYGDVRGAVAGTGKRWWRPGRMLATRQAGTLARGMDA